MKNRDKFTMANIVVAVAACYQNKSTTNTWMMDVNRCGI